MVIGSWKYEEITQNPLDSLTPPWVGPPHFSTASCYSLGPETSLSVSLSMEAFVIVSKEAWDRAGFPPPIMESLHVNYNLNVVFFLLGWGQVPLWILARVLVFGFYHGYKVFGSIIPFTWVEDKLSDDPPGESKHGEIETKKSLTVLLVFYNSYEIVNTLVDT